MNKELLQLFDIKDDVVSSFTIDVDNKEFNCEINIRFKPSRKYFVHTCFSWFCNKYGSKAAQQRTAHFSAIAFESKHRHIVFTILKKLRPFFLKGRSLLKDFFAVSYNVTGFTFQWL